MAGAYTLSNTLPNQIYELFMGGLLSSIFVPLLVERLSRHGAQDAHHLTDALLTLILPALIVVAAAGIIYLVTHLVFPLPNWAKPRTATDARRPG